MKTKNLLLLTLVFAISAFLAVAGNAQNLSLDGDIQVVASSTINANFPEGSTVDGDRTGYGWGAGGGWNDATRDVFPDTVTYTTTRPATAPYSFGKFVVTTLQDNFSSPIEPTPMLTCSLYGIRNFRIEVLDTTGTWVNVASIVNNILCKREIVIQPIRGTASRIHVDASWDTHYSRIIEYEMFVSSP